MARPDEEKRKQARFERELDAKAEELQRADSECHERLRERANAVGLSPMTIAKIVDSYPTAVEGFRALSEEIERREKSRQP